MNRNEIAAELMNGCPAELEKSHNEIADAIRNGNPVGTILEMCDGYTDTYVWLENQFAECEDA